MSWAIYGLIVFAGLAMMVREGLWSNTITLFNIIISGLVAFGFYSPLTAWLDEKFDGTLTYVLDLVIVWGLFVISMIVCRAVTRAASRTRMRFKHPIDPVGGPIVGLIAAWVLAGFVTATLFMAPMPKTMLTERLRFVADDFSNLSPDTGTIIKVCAFNPEIVWLWFVERMTDSVAYGPSLNRPFLAKDFVQVFLTHRGTLEEKGADAPYLKVRRN